MILAIDLGSNTLRAVLYDCESKKVEYTYEKVVKTADGLAEFGCVNSHAVCRVINAIQEIQMAIDFTQHKIKAVTTETLRRAMNAKDVLEEIFEVTGVTFDVITGEEEASYTLTAVKTRLEILQHASDSFVLIDIGGGSTEIIFQYSEGVYSKSFPVGIVTIAQTYKTLENIHHALSKEMLDMQMFCAEIYDTKGKPDSFIATAGTPTTVAAMKLGMNYHTYDASKVNGTSLSLKELDFYLRKLLSLPFNEREVTVGTGRSDLIAAGILIYSKLFQILEFKTNIIIDDGLREGVAIDMCLH